MGYRSVKRAETHLTGLEKLTLYRQMLLIRLFEEKAAEMYAKGRISGFTHLYIGQEAVAVGVVSAIHERDYVISAYREHGHALAKGCEPREVMAELFGKVTGICGGRGGSMHLCDAKRRFMGGYAIVGGQMPIAVGLGLSVTMKGEDDIVVCLFGDGAVNQGAFHESLNLAKLWNLPVIFLCENNLYGMGTALIRAASEPDIDQHGCAYGIPGVEVDGMDVLAVREAVAASARAARSGEGPTLIEAMTYRFRGHSMADPLQYRTSQEEAIWKERDPINTFAAFLLEDGTATEEELKAIQQEVVQEVEAAVAFAEESPEPPLETLMDRIYVPEKSQPAVGVQHETGIPPEKGGR